jgi:hypothetical protein
MKNKKLWIISLIGHIIIATIARILGLDYNIQLMVVIFLSVILGIAMKDIDNEYKNNRR